MKQPQVTYSQLYRKAVISLKQAGISHVEQEALWILEHGLRMDRLTLHLWREEPVGQDDYQRTMELLGRRASREPLQYVLGTQEFWGRDMAVNSAVLIPRPETELVVEETLECLSGNPRPLIVDVGTGSGCLAVSLALEKPLASVVALDRSPTALHVARSNALRHGTEARIRWVAGDLLTPLLSRKTAGKVTAIVANLPYISQAEWEHLPPDVKNFEPRLALYGGADGFDEYRRLFRQIRPVLAVGGFLVMEIGVEQGQLVRQEVSRYPFLKILKIRKDGLEIERVVCLQRQKP